MCIWWWFIDFELNNKQYRIMYVQVYCMQMVLLKCKFISLMFYFYRLCRDAKKLDVPIVIEWRKHRLKKKKLRWANVVERKLWNFGAGEWQRAIQELRLITWPHPGEMAWHFAQWYIVFDQIWCKFKFCFIVCLYYINLSVYGVSLILVLLIN